MRRQSGALGVAAAAAAAPDFAGSSLLLPQATLPWSDREHKPTAAQTPRNSKASIGLRTAPRDAKPRAAMMEKKNKAAKANKKQRNVALSKSLAPNNSKNMKMNKKKKEQRRRHGPRIPTALHKDLKRLNPDTSHDESDRESEEIFMEENAYEYEEAVAEEEARKNRRFDSVENYEYELPEDFEKFVLSDFQGDLVDGPININDLLDPLHGKPGFSNLRKRLQQLERKPLAVQAPLPKVEREKLERKVAYEHAKKDITKWEPLVKRNREAPTLYFDEDVNLGYSTVGAIASEFTPRTEFEKKMSLLVHNPEVVEAHNKDGARLLELNKVCSFKVVPDVLLHVLR
ncbi:hypothetical protein B296_00033910 [Ensete ventricosum]|uniref:Uncharacterized protein n=1 Tax=Ensete ventricosum TaxID=4639 RepID=A0A426ZLA6_ENSVE|nr:hypothetical protein B296_00033910 [Ensete ventricosum]